jgi:tRNA U34 5-carboxymethylaminomethyl modifying GTPase MnmE/TrmE
VSMMTAAQTDFTSLTDIRIGTRLGDIKRQLLALGEDLEGALHQRVAGFVGDRLKEVESHSCRIAVIGQIKAGKSSLVNALTRRPDLLPTDVNPSTAVITKLYFGGPAEKANSALFHFFSDEEWERIMSGGRPGAAATSASAAGGTRLQGQLEELKERAQRRLGPQMGSLLGKHHLFKSVTSSVLERYVSAADAVGGADGEEADDRHYSDITKIAEVYLDGQPLGYPAIVIDTPGVNDPFMVRDEITHANLGDADIYLVVLTAQQPLSGSDLALLRMLRGLQKDRIIAVVNRVDIVDGSPEHYQRLTVFVQEALRREFPHAAIPVILASARWGNAALNADDEEMQDLLSPAFAAFSGWSGAMPESEVRGWSREGHWPRPRIAQAFYKASGVPAIIAAIARLIGHSVAEERILPAAATLGAIAENTASSLRHNAKSMQARLGPGDAPVAAFREHARQTLAQLERLLARIEDNLGKADSELTRLLQQDLHRLGGYMRFRADQFAAHQGELLATSTLAELRAGFQQESFALRGQLAEDFYTYVTDIAKQLTARQRDAENDLRQAAKDTLPEIDDVLHFGLQPPGFSAPSIIPLSRTTAFDSEDFWLDRQRGELTSIDEAAAFTTLVKSEFGEMIDALLALADAALREHVAAALRRLRFLSYSAIYPIAQQLQHFAEVLQQREAGGHGSPVAADRFGDLFAQWDDIRRKCERDAAALKDLRRQCIAMLDQ